MEKWSDLKKWAEEEADKHITDILKESGLSEEEIEKTLNTTPTLKKEGEI